MNLLFLVLAALAGCVSIKTHEKAQHEAYVRGLKDGDRILTTYECEDAKWLLKNKIDRYDLGRAARRVGPRPPS